MDDLRKVQRFVFVIEACTEIGVDPRNYSRSQAFVDVCRQYAMEEIDKADFQSLVDKIVFFNECLKK